MNAFITFRYAVFALFIIFNSIICSVAAWNLGQLKAVGLPIPVDAYLIFLGVFGLLVIFPVIFIELARKGAVVTRVWFEITWVGLFWILHLAGAAAFTAMAPSFVCGSRALKSFEGVCISQNTVKTFTWLSTLTLLAYLVTLIVCSALHMKAVPNIWHTGVCDVSWFAKTQRLGSSPPTPVRVMYTRSSSESGSSTEKHTGPIIPLFLPQAQTPHRQQSQSRTPHGQPRQSPPLNAIRVTERTVTAIPVAPPAAHHPAHQPPARRAPIQYNPTSLYPSHVQNTVVQAGFFKPEAKPQQAPPAPQSQGSPTNGQPAPTRTSPRTSPSGRRPRPPPLDLTLATRPLGTRVPARR